MPPVRRPNSEEKSSIHSSSVDKKKFVGVEEQTAQILQSVLARIRYVGIEIRVSVKARPKISRAAVRT